MFQGGFIIPTKAKKDNRQMRMFELNVQETLKNAHGECLWRMLVEISRNMSISLFKYGKHGHL